MSLLDFGPIYTNTGAILQIEYATKSAENGSTVIGINTQYGLIICVEKPIDSPLYKIDDEKRVHKIKSNIIIAGTGMLHDILPLKDVINNTLEMPLQIRNEISGNDIKKAVSYSASIFTKYYGMRPIGCHIMFGHSEKNIPVDGASSCKIGPDQKTKLIKTRLFVTDCSSLTKEVKAYAIGKGTSRAKTELEKLDIGSLTLYDAIDQAIRIMYKCFDPLKDKPFLLEVAVLTDKHREVEKSVVEEIAKNYKDLNVDDE